MIWSPDAAARVEQHVRRLDVAVHQAAAVRRVQSGGDLRKDLGDAAGWQRPDFGQQRANIAAAHVPHRDEQHAARFAGLEDRDDVRVVDSRGRS